jgi:hypothetical protein
LTIAFDPTELLGSRIWGDGSTDTIVWTWNRATGTDPSITFTSGGVQFNCEIGIGTDPGAELHVVSNDAVNTEIRADNTGGGDTAWGFYNNGDLLWYLGVDNSDANSFKLAPGALGTDDAFAIDSNGNWTIAGTINLVDISGAAGGLTIDDAANSHSIGLKGDIEIQAEVDGFTMWGGTTSRTLTLTGGDWTIDQDVSNGASPTFGTVTATRLALTGMNSHIVTPNDTLGTEYNWLKSGDRDGDMGALSATNRRTLVLTPGVYTLSSAFTLDTDFVDISSLAGNPKGAWITRPTGGSAVVQSANDVSLTNFTIETTGTSDGQTGGDIGLEITASDNTYSYYSNMHFIGTAVGTRTGLPVFGTEDIGGTWTNCHSSGWAWRVAANKELKANMYDCVSWYDEIGEYVSNAGYGRQSFGGDTSGADISGRFYRCITGDGSFGGCTTWGANCSGLFVDCQSGKTSFSLARHFTGTALRCIVGFGSFGSGSTYGGVNAKFAGTAVDCIVSGMGSGGINTWTTETAGSFGMGGGSSEGITAGAKIINCRYGLFSDYARGNSRAATNTVASSGVQATLTTNMNSNEPNSNIVLTAVDEGEDGNGIAFKISLIPIPMWTVTVSARVISVIKQTGLAKTAAELKTLLDAESDVTDIVSIAQAGDGTDNIDDTYTQANLSGGADRPIIRGNHPILPQPCDSATTVYYFDNGHTYTNEGAGGAVTMTLPPAILGFEYSFVLAVAQEFRLDPDGTETVALANGTQQAAGKYITANAVGERCTLRCVVAGQWEHYNSLGTWTAEP